MPYISHLQNNKIFDSADKEVGRLKDVLIKSHIGKYSALDYLEIKPKKGKGNIFIPYSFVENFSKEEISLKTVFSKIPVENGLRNDHHYAHLIRDVMDQQIVDVAGARVVRVNDLRIGDFEGKMCVLGLDISFKGLMRRLNIDRLDIFDLWKVNLIDWRKAQPVKGTLKLDTVSKDLTRLHPADLANIIEDLSVKNGSRLVTSLDDEAAAKVLEEVDPKLQKILVHQFTPEQITRILTKMSVDEVVDLLKDLPVDEEEIIMSHLQNGKLRKIKQLLRYHNDTAGGLMNTDYITVRPENSVDEVIKEIKNKSEGLRTVLYVYATDENNKFLGSVSLRWLLISNKDTKIKDIMKKVPHQSILHPHQPVEDVINIMTKYDLNSAAVLDDSDKLIGVVTIDDVMRHLVPHA